MKRNPTITIAQKTHSIESKKRDEVIEKERLEKIDGIKESEGWHQNSPSKKEFEK